MILLQKKMRRMLFTLLTLFVTSTGFLYCSSTTSDVVNHIQDALTITDGQNRERIPYIPGMPTALVLLNKDRQPAFVYVHDIHAHETEDFLEIANELANVASMENWQPGNLWQQNHAWRWSDRHTLVIADIEPVKHSLLHRILACFLLCLLAEICLWILTKKVVDHMTRPIEETLEKQKRFIQDASHELKTPLAIIMASADAMESSPNPKWLANIQTESERMDKLIHTMLDLSTSEMDVPGTDLNLSKTVEQAVLPYEALLYEHGCSLNTVLQPDVWVKADKDGLIQLTGILLDNARKHARPDSCVEVAVHALRNKAVLEVINQGDPIPPGEEEKIFARFYRVDKARNRADGRYGLGLAIAKNICERHEASIHASSKNGTTTFKVEFPLIKKH